MVMGRQRCVFFALAVWLPRVVAISRQLIFDTSILHAPKAGAEHEQQQMRLDILNSPLWATLARCTRAVAEQCTLACHLLPQQQRQGQGQQREGRAVPPAAPVPTPAGGPAAVCRTAPQLPLRTRPHHPHQPQHHHHLVPPRPHQQRRQQLRPQPAGGSCWSLEPSPRP